MASYQADPLPLGYPSSNLHEHVDAESEDDQVDQLESDSDVEVSDPEAMSSFMKNSRQDERLPGHTVLPSVRLENIIQADGKHALQSTPPFQFHCHTRCYRQSCSVKGRALCALCRDGMCSG